MRLLIRFQRFLICCAALTAALSAASGFARGGVVDETPALPQEIRHIPSYGSQSLDAFYLDLISLILDAGSDKFGPYKLNTDSRPMSVARARKGLLENEWDSLVNSDLSNQFHGTDQIAVFSRPYLKHMIGLRQSIIDSRNLAQLSQIRSLDELKQFKIGQGSNWTEVEIYRAADVNVVTSESFGNLFRMLTSGRFQLLPLSVLEVDGALANASTTQPTLTILPDIYIYYPLPVQIVVSRNNPLIAARYQYGIEQIFSDGSLTKLLQKHFPKQLANPIPKEATIIILPNPKLSEAENAAIIQTFRNTTTY